VAKVWMMFPLTKEQAIEEAGKLNKKTFIEVPQIIDSSPNVIRSNEAKSIAIKSPVWIEMNKGVGQFERTITIENPDAWQKGQDGPVYRIVVYVMQPEGKAAMAIRLRSPTDPNNFVFGVVKPVPDWKLYRDMPKIDPKEKIEKIEPK